MKSRVFASASCLGAALLLASTTLAPINPAVAQTPAVFRSVQIDMSGIPTGALEARRQLQACLSRAVPAALAGRVQPGARGAPVLTVRPTTLWLANQDAAGMSDDFNSKQGSGGADVLEGEAIIGSQRISISAAANGDLGATGWTEYGARLRTDQLCTNFALWLARKI
jgi:hypothetical protein